MSLSFPKYHDIHPISHVLLDYIDNQKARDCVLSLIKSEYSVIRSLLQMDVDGVTKLTTQVIMAYLSRYGDWTDIHLKRRYAQDLAKRSISKFYDGLVAPSSLTISLLLNTKRAEKGRHGDLSFIIKLARGLVSWGARINIATNETEKAKTLLKGIGCNVLNIADKQTSSCLLKSDLVIEAPVFRISLCQIRKKLKENGRLIQIREYSCSAINQMREARQVTQAIVEKILPKLSAFGGEYPDRSEELSKLTYDTSGPGHDELGIFVDQDLYKKSRGVARRANRLGRSAVLKEGVAKITCSYLRQALSSSLVNNPILYFGYGDENYEYFVEIIAQLESRNTGLRSVIICIVESSVNLTINPASDSSRSPPISSKLSGCLRRLKQQGQLQGFSNAKFVLAIPTEIYAQMRKSPPAKSCDALPSQKDTLSKGFISKTDFGKTSQNSEASKMLTVISIPYLCPEDMQTMQALAEDVILCTGDQSVSEAISANKIWLYDCSYHKESFLERVISRAREEVEGGKRCAELLLAFKNKETKKVMELLQDKSLLLKQFEKLNYVLRKKDLLQEITYLVQHKIVDSQSPKTAKAAADLTNRFVAYLTKRKEATAKEALDQMKEEEGFFSDFDQLYCSLNHFETVQLLNSLLQRDRE